MLDTLLKIGEWQSRGKSEWDRFLDKSKINLIDKQGNPITHFMLPIIFDLDVMDVVIDSKNLKEYDEELAEPLKALKVQGGNNKAIYATVPSIKFIQLYKTFFGKEDENSQEGEISEAIRKENPSLLTDSFNILLTKIFALKERFFQLGSLLNEKTGAYEINFRAIEDILALNKNEIIVLVYAQVKGAKFGFNSPKSFAEIPEYIEFLKSKFLKQENKITHKSEKDKTTSHPEKLCYASGKLSDNVDELNLSSRYSLNKMFVTETKNYVSQFNKSNFRINYQVSKENQEKLDYASNYLLNEGNYKVKIANIDHVIVPQFLESDNLDLEMALMGIKNKSDILFNYETLENTVKNIKDETELIFWINFIAYESDGNFFKSTETIKDISNFHFQKVITAFREVHWEFKEANFVDWNNVMTEFGTSGKFYNLNTVYSLIPLRKDKEKKNKALELFKAILEDRKVNRIKLYNYFSELILCHYYERYNGYTNIPKSSKDYFRNTVRDSVFKYYAFIQVLRKLKLIDMEQSANNIAEETGNKYDQAIQTFFTKMQLTPDQQAMFYLGRMLNAVEWIQIQKKIKKTVINKVNFNGIELSGIERLRRDLVDKARQHGQMGKVLYSDRKFGELFNYNKWNKMPMDPNEALFFLLTGYSFGVSVKEVDQFEKVEQEPNN